MNNRLIPWAVTAFAIVVILLNTVFIVDQRSQAVVLRLGEPVGTVNADGKSPGLHIKVPFFENVVQFDRRILNLEADQEEINTSDQERLVVDAYIRYRITDPLRYYVTLRNETTATDRMGRLINSSLRQVLGAASSNEIISSRRAQLMTITRDDAARRARAARLGVTILDVRIKRADLPESNRLSVYERMKTNLEQQAAQIQARGEQQRREIIATAEKEVTVTLAEATEKAGQIQGEGDAQATAIYASSFGKDPSFAAFYRSMQAYETSLRDNNTTLVLSPDSAFFRYFEGGPGGGR